MNASSAEESRVLVCRDENQDSFDAVITDNSMGNESGLDFIGSLRKGGVRGLPKNLPCVLCSGDSHEFDDLRTLSITKPFSSGDIAEALSALKLSDDSKV